MKKNLILLCQCIGIPDGATEWIQSCVKYDENENANLVDTFDALMAGGIMI